MTRDEINKEIIEAFGRALLRSTHGLGQAIEFYFLEEIEKNGLVICTKEYIEELEEFKINQQLKDAIDAAAEHRKFWNDTVSERRGKNK